MVTSIPKSEIKLRWETAKSQLDQKNQDALLIPLGVNFYYLFGKQGTPSERLIAGIIPRDGDPFIIGPSFEKSNIERSTGIEDIVGWNETESPYKILGKEFEDRGIGNTIVVDPKLWIIEVERLEKASGRNFYSGHTMLDSMRSRKSSWELEQLALACEYSSKGILNAIDRLEEGVSELEFQKTVGEEMSALSGNLVSFTLVQFGENSAIPHGMPSSKKLKMDEAVLIDAGTSVNGYHGDITITVPFGKPKDFKEIYEIVYEANRKAFDANKEGIPAGDLDKIARDHIGKKGYGEYFTHRLGHGLGLEVHEHPYIVASNSDQLVAGNVHTIEPGIYIPGKYGIRIEDNVAVTTDGAKYNYKTPRHNFS